MDIVIIYVTFKSQNEGLQFAFDENGNGSGI